MEAFKRQQIRCLVSVSALAVGFNAKHVDLIGLARPTKAPAYTFRLAGAALGYSPARMIA